LHRFVDCFLGLAMLCALRLSAPEKREKGVGFFQELIKCLVVLKLEFVFMGLLFVDLKELSDWNLCVIKTSGIALFKAKKNGTNFYVTPWFAR
jgi:hypothetical protein